MPKFGSGDQDRSSLELRAVEDEVRVVLAPGREQTLAESGALHALEVHRRDDLVGIDVASLEGNSAALDFLDWFHGLMLRVGYRSAGVANVPAMAVAAATCGETRWVRPPLPWRPSKLRLLVDAQRSPG